MKFYAVVHVTHSHGSLPVINADRAMRAGADGVFLINHGVRPHDLVDVAHRVHAAFPELWIGMNFLGLRAAEAFHCLPDYVKGLWTDNAQSPSYAEAHEGRRRSSWFGEYFGGTAFKYQSQPKDLREATLEAAKYMEVICTSGPGTGKAPDVEKIRIMGEAAKEKDRGLAIASGITPENVKLFMPHATHLLVATGVSKSFEELDQDRMKALVDVIKGQ